MSMIDEGTQYNNYEFKNIEGVNNTERDIRVSFENHQLKSARGVIFADSEKGFFDGLDKEIDKTIDRLVWLQKVRKDMKRLNNEHKLTASEIERQMVG